MKNLSFFLLLMWGTCVLAETITVKVSGMTCGGCVKSITKELESSQKCEKIDVNLEKSQASFDVKDGQKLSDAEIKSLIKKAGYEAQEIVRK